MVLGIASGYYSWDIFAPFRRIQAIHVSNDSAEAASRKRSSTSQKDMTVKIILGKQRCTQFSISSAIHILQFFHESRSEAQRESRMFKTRPCHSGICSDYVRVVFRFCKHQQNPSNTRFVEVCSMNAK